MTRNTSQLVLPHTQIPQWTDAGRREEGVQYVTHFRISQILIVTVEIDGTWPASILAAKTRRVIGCWWTDDVSVHQRRRGGDHQQQKHQIDETVAATEGRWEKVMV